MTEWTPLSLQHVKSYPLGKRTSKVNVSHFAGSWNPGGTLKQWLDALPQVLAATDFKGVVDAVAEAAVSRKTVILAMGAHPIKVGLSPVILELMSQGIVTGLAMNGAGIIHDAEIAMVGHTSEDVAAEIGEGRFGMAEETGRFLNAAVVEGADKGWGLGKSVGSMLVREGFPHNPYSLLATAHERGIPVTVHVALGTDIIHVHPTADGAAIGRASHLDFRIFAHLVSTLYGGVFVNLGSAVIMPEVFLKALSLVRNLGHEVKDFTTVNMDFVRSYRPMTNVVQRPTMEGGRGYNLIGHHEIMFPLLAAAVMEALNDRKQR